MTAPLEQRYARAAVVVGVASIASAVFVFTAGFPEYVDIVDLEPPGAAAFAVLGILSLVGGLRRSFVLCATAAAGFFLAAGAILLQLATGVSILGGDATSLALFGAWGLALLCACWADRQTPPGGGEDGHVDVPERGA
jgi:hypothetical protein